MRGLVAVLLILASGLAAAQERAPTQRVWSLDGREPQWRARIEARDGAVERVSVLRRDAGGVVLEVVERKDERNTTFVERRDKAGQVVWRHPLPGVPARQGSLQVIAVEGKTRADLTLAAVFIPEAPKPGDAFAKLIEVDIGGGTLRVAGGFTYPEKKRLTTDDWMELTRAKALPSGLIVFYGGIGSGPFAPWVGLRKPDGTVLWDVVSRRGLGHVVDIRQDGTAFDVSLVHIMSRDLTAGTGTFRLRIDAAGRVAGSVKLWQRESGFRFTPDGGMAYVAHAEGKPTTIHVLDRAGRVRFVRTLPEDTHGIASCLEDGTIVLNRKDGFLMLASDGNALISIPARDFRTEMLPDGTVVDETCEGEKCPVRLMSLFDRPR